MNWWCMRTWVLSPEIISCMTILDDVEKKGLKLNLKMYLSVTLEAFSLLLCNKREHYKIKNQKYIF